MTLAFHDHLTLKARSGFWFFTVLLVVILVPAGFELVVAQPQGADSRKASGTSEAKFVALGEHVNVNVNNIAYAVDDGKRFDIYFACSSTRGTDPLRLTRQNDLTQARSFFNDERRYNSHFEKYGNYCININHVAYVEVTGNSASIYFAARVADAFVQLTLSGADAENFMKKHK